MCVVSIIVPVYNVEEFLAECIESILHQTLQDIEIILVDDGSTDGSGSICDEYRKLDERVRVIHKSNGGLSSARNAGIEEASGKYIAFVDSDDYVDTDMYKVMTDAADRYNADIVVCQHYQNENGHKIFKGKQLESAVMYHHDEALDNLVIETQMTSYAWDKLYRRKLFDGIRFPLNRYFEDFAVSYRLFDLADKVCQIPDALYYYRIVSTSISHSFSSDNWRKKYHDLLLNQIERIAYFKEKNYQTLEEVSYARIVPYAFSDMIDAYRASDFEMYEADRKYLLQIYPRLKNNTYLSKKNKLLLRVYLLPKVLFGVFAKYKK